MVAIVPVHELTEKQAVLLECLVNGGSLRLAAKEAGYVSTASAAQILRSEKVALAFQQRMAARLATGAPLMFGVLEDIATNRAAPAGARVDAAKAWLDRAGWTVPRQAEKSTADKPLHEMSAAELKATVLELKAIRDTSTGPAPDATLADMMS